MRGRERLFIRAPMGFVGAGKARRHALDSLLDQFLDVSISKPGQWASSAVVAQAHGSARSSQQVRLWRTFGIGAILPREAAERRYANCQPNARVHGKSRERSRPAVLLRVAERRRQRHHQRIRMILAEPKDHLE
jgi:hypothetical protein